MSPWARLACSISLAVAVEIFIGASAVAQQGGRGGAREDGQWTMPAKDYASTRYSGLAQITAGNARRLRPVWSFSTGVLGGHEGQPLVVDKTMYVVTPYPTSCMPSI